MKDISHYKLIYLDTNIVSDISKSGKLILKFLKEFPPNQNYLLCFSTYTLYEIRKSKKFYEGFMRLYSVFPCAILMSYFPLGKMEIDLISGNIDKISPIIFSPVGLTFEGKKMLPNSLELLLSREEVVEGFRSIDDYTPKFYNEIQNLLNEQEFISIKNSVKNKRDVFLKKYKKYELRKRFLISNDIVVDEIKLKKMKTLEVLSYCIYYKFISDPKRKYSINDIIDILIMTTVPYVHTFISERNSITILEQIKKQSSVLNSVNLMTLSDLKVDDKIE